MDNLTPEQLQEFLSSDAAKSILEKNAQAAVAATTAKYEAEFKALTDEKERLQFEKMTEQERIAHERKKLEEEIEQQEKRIRQLSLESRANQLITQYNLPSEAMELIASDNESALIQRATLLSRLMSNGAKQQQKQYSSFNQAPTEKNPWSKEHFNLTNQGRMLRDYPEKARQMAAQYGMKL